MKILRPLSILLLACLAMPAGADALDEALEFGRFAEARALIEGRLAQNPGDIELRIKLGRTHLGENDLAAAAEQFRLAIEAAPDSADAHYWHGAAHGTLAANASVFRAGAHANRARAGLSRALELDPRHVRAHLGMIGYYRNAPRLFGGDEDKALELTHELIELDPYEGTLTLAAHEFKDGDAQQAVTALQELTAQFPRDPRAYVQLGLRAQADEDFDKAHDFFATATAGAGDSEATRRARQMALYQAGRTAVFSGAQIDAGIGALEKYLELNLYADLPDKAWARFRLARLCELRGNDGRAAELYREARESTDDNELLRQIKRRL